ncbi:MAG: PAS domain S-box protein [Desulfobacterales bacterium]
MAASSNDNQVRRLLESSEEEKARHRRLEKQLEESRSLLRRAMESREKYRKLVEDIDAVIFSTDAEGRLTYISPTIEKFTGFRPGVYSGRHFLEAVHEDDRHRVLGAYTRVVSGKLGSSEYRLRHRSKGHMWLRSFSRPVYDKGAFTGLRGIGIDISRRKDAEATARRTEKKYQSLLDSIEEGYFEFDLTGRLKFASPTLCRIVGLSPADLQNTHFRQYVSRKIARRIVRKFLEIHRSGKHAVHRDLVVKREGRAIIVEISASLILDEHQNPVGYRGLLSDVTDRRRSERNQRRLEHQLQEAQRLEAVGTLAGGIAHNFNNILMAMQGNISLLLLKAEAADPMAEKLRNLEQCIRDGSSLTRQLLDFASTRRTRSEPADLNLLILKTARMISRTKKEITIDISGLKKVWNVEVDNSQIEQVFLNLFVNSWQAMPKGGTLSIRTCNVILSDQFVRFYGLQPGRFVKISVNDTGEGMDESVQQKIFHPFFTTKGMQHGTGLGLTSAYGIVKNHGGIILVNSRMGRGTTFCIYLPATAKSAAAASYPPEEPIRGSGTLLLVDDEPFVLDITSESLKEIGYTVFSARSGEEAVDIYRAYRSRIDLVILDLTMPGMDGSETFQKLRELDPEIRVLLMSGYDYCQRVEDLRRQGCRGFIQKPFDMNVLSRKISRILSS